MTSGLSRSSAEDEIGLVKIAPQRVAGLLEQPAGVLDVGVRPQEGDELVSADTVSTHGGEEGEQGERLALLRGPAAGRTVDGD